MAPDKNHKDMIKPMASIHQDILKFKEEKKLIKSTPIFAPAGQSSQMIIGATKESDLDIIKTSTTLYQKFNLKRVYFSGYVPVLEHKNLPILGTPVPLVRENRLYQTDWLMRFYQFNPQEIVNEDHPNLDLEIDPKLSWALRNREYFPIDVNKADYHLILRIPGVGVKSAKKIIAARKFGALNMDKLRKFGIAMNRAQHFITCGNHVGARDMDSLTLRQLILQNGSSKFSANFSPQLSLFQ
ncbi:hypothetical protein KIH41_02405 [Litoribacter ruber]|uniref:hypothetical protein n=1 Tax=Litoribacter ruber TaxID=702568 RepID=UPI001BDA3FDB|nr:hypothetical protein [Litoribacter ruber]MBT0810132.1 hypothetical protein [Litoribacter ruber]